MSQRIILFFALLFMWMNVSAQSHDFDKKQLKRLLMSTKGAGLGDWNAAFDSAGAMPDTVTLFSYPFGYRANDVCDLWTWSFRSASRVDVCDTHRCHEPPYFTLKPGGVNLKLKVIKQWGRAYLTLTSSRLPVMTFVVISAIIGEPSMVGGRPHSVTLVRYQP